MKLLFDENLSSKLPENLSFHHPDSTHVRDVGLKRAGDEEIWAFAKFHGFTIVSKDSDFADRSALESSPPKVIWIRSGNCSTANVRRLLTAHHDRVRQFIEEDKEACLVLR